jgi:hypothetical protein
MGKKKKIVDDGETKSAKENTTGKPSASKKIRLEIPRDTWVRLEAYIKNYNKDPERLSPKTDTDRVIFEALAAHLASSPKG